MICGTKMKHQIPEMRTMITLSNGEMEQLGDAKHRRYMYHRWLHTQWWSGDA